MPHDHHGALLEVGDIVHVPCRVKQVMTGTDYCNVSLETVHPMFPEEHANTLSLNGTQVVKVAA